MNLLNTKYEVRAKALKDLGSFHTGPCRNRLKWRIMLRVTSNPLKMMIEALSE